MARPSALDSLARREEFATLVAADMVEGGLDQAAKNVVQHAKTAKLDPWRALRLSYEPSFVAQVERLVRPRGDF
jgi:hypothetical protein